MKSMIIYKEKKETAVILKKKKIKMDKFRLLIYKEEWKWGNYQRYNKYNKRYSLKQRGIIYTSKWKSLSNAESDEWVA